MHGLIHSLHFPDSFIGLGKDKIPSYCFATALSTTFGEIQSLRGHCVKLCGQLLTVMLCCMGLYIGYFYHLF